MNLYVLVEGEETEMQVYSRWIEQLLGFKKIKTPQEAEHQHFFLISGYGYPNILKNELPDAIATINENSHKFNYLILCLDSEDGSIQDRIDEVWEVIQEHNLELEEYCSLEIIVQHRCMETWFLGNKFLYPRQPNTPDFIEFSRYYNVCENDPEKMGKHTSKNHAHFHKRYLTAMLLEKNLHYQKNNPKVVCESSYITELQKRVAGPETHLQSLKKFFDFCAKVHTSLSTAI